MYFQEIARKIANERKLFCKVSISVHKCPQVEGSVEVGWRTWWGTTRRLSPSTSPPPRVCAVLTPGTQARIMAQVYDEQRHASVGDIVGVGVDPDRHYVPLSFKQTADEHLQRGLATLFHQRLFHDLRISDSVQPSWLGVWATEGQDTAHDLLLAQSMTCSPCIWTGSPRHSCSYYTGNPWVARHKRPRIEAMLTTNAPPPPLAPILKRQRGPFMTPVRLMCHAVAPAFPITPALLTRQNTTALKKLSVAAQTAHTTHLWWRHIVQTWRWAL